MEEYLICFDFHQNICKFDPLQLSRNNLMDNCDVIQSQCEEKLEFIRRGELKTIMLSLFLTT